MLDVWPAFDDAATGGAAVRAGSVVDTHQPMSAMPTKAALATIVFRGPDTLPLARLR
jgi:hypothetical protein